MTFSIRDLFWLILVAAVAAGWAAHLRYWIQVEQRLVDRARLAEAEQSRLLHHYDGVQAAIDAAGIEWPPTEK
jgi:hypothetical protein